MTIAWDGIGHFATERVAIHLRTNDTEIDPGIWQDDLVRLHCESRSTKLPDNVGLPACRFVISSLNSLPTVAELWRDVCPNFLIQPNQMCWSGSLMEVHALKASLLNC